MHCSRIPCEEKSGCTGFTNTNDPASVIVARDPVSRKGSDSGVDRHGQSRPLQLPAVYRLVDEFDVASDAGHGTTIRATKWCRRR